MLFNLLAYSIFLAATLLAFSASGLGLRILHAASFVFYGCRGRHSFALRVFNVYRSALDVAPDWLASTGALKRR